MWESSKNDPGFVVGFARKCDPLIGLREVLEKTLPETGIGRLGTDLRPKFWSGIVK